MNMHWSSFGRTHIGNVREQNEDAFLDWPEAGIWCVADGMGGHFDGAQASEQLVQEIERIDVQGFRDSLDVKVIDALHAVDRSLKDSRENEDGRMSGCTAAVLVFVGSLAHCIWVGDSRIYRMRRGELQLLTSDHTQANELFENGLITQADLPTHPGRNILTRAIGGSGALNISTDTTAIIPGDQFLICSDGLTEMLSHEQLAVNILRGACSDSSYKLIEEALEEGASDNITAVRINVESQQGDETMINFSISDRLPGERDE